MKFLLAVSAMIYINQSAPTSRDIGEEFWWAAILLRVQKYILTSLVWLPFAFLACIKSFGCIKKEIGDNQKLTKKISEKKRRHRADKVSHSRNLIK